MMHTCTVMLQATARMVHTGARMVHMGAGMVHKGTGFVQNKKNKKYIPKASMDYSIIANSNHE